MYVFKKSLVKTLLFFSFIILGVSRFAYADIDQGLDYLAIQQQSAGNYLGQNSISTDLQATAEVIRTFNFLAGGSAADIAAARSFLQTNASGNTEDLSRLIILAAQASENTQTLTTSLLAHQNDYDGGFGDFEGYDSTVLDTAFALEALAESGLQPASVLSAVSFLLNAQKNDGSWSDGVNESSVYLTSIAMRALWHYRSVFGGVSSALTKAQNYLLQARNTTTGLWSEPHESALALIAIVPNVAELTQVESILDNLRNLQLPNGSWSDDAYVTALAIRALASQPTPQPEPITQGNLIGFVANSTTKQAIAGVTISIASIPASTTTDVDGVFTLADLDPGTYSVEISAPGYQTLTFASVSVVVGVDNSMGEILLSPLPTTGVLQGNVTDAATGQALDGATVSLSGAVTASTNTVGGQFALAGLTPGDIVITVARDGYLPVTATATVLAGQTLVLSPSLTPTSSGSEPLPGTATTGDLRGVVTDVGTGAPLVSVGISVLNATDGSFIRFVRTSSDGSYSITGLPVGDIRINTSRSGYIGISANATVLGGNVLVFSPGLVQTGGNPDDGTIDTGAEPLPGTPANGVLQGVATDIETALPLGGVTINVTGAIDASVVTAADGTYSIADIPPGDVTLVASLNDYLSVTAQGSVAAGNATVFNPELTPVGFVSDTPGGIVGRIVDASGNGLRFARVRVTSDTEEFVVSTDFRGNFEETDIPAGNYTFLFERSGYVSQIFNGVIASGSTIDFQTVELKRILTQVSLIGQILDIDTQEPIENALVSISGTTFSAQTDAQGNYRLNGLDVGTKTVLFNATGYATQTLIFTFPEGGEFEINRSLSSSSSNGVDITFLGTDKQSYAAYEPVSIQSSVLNNGTNLDAMVTYSIYDDQDQFVSEYQATLSGSSEQQITFATGVVTEVGASFDTLNMSPGEYKLIARVILGDQLVGPASIILDERVSQFSIETTRRIESVNVDMVQASSAVGVTETINLLASIVNRSNVDTSIRLSYQLRNTSGSILFSSRVINVPVALGQDSLVIDLDSFSQEFLSSGEHELVVLYRGGTRPDNINGDSITVAPGLRIDAIQSVTPEVVTPDGDKRIRINIRLEGKEVE